MSYLVLVPRNFLISCPCDTLEQAEYTLELCKQIYEDSVLVETNISKSDLMDLLNKAAELYE